MDDSARRRFRMGACLGRGGFGEVYLATMVAPSGLQSVVAVKVLRADVGAQLDAVRRLRDEGRMLANLRHPTVVHAVDLCTLGGRIALVTEYVEGADLSELIRGPDRMGPRALLQVVGAVSDALEAAWSTPGRSGAPMHLIHRDIKPTNIRIGRHGDTKLLDFGIATFQGEEREARTASDLIVGSLPYMAPERFVDRTTEPAADVFSLGCTLFEGLCAGPFYAGGKLKELSRLALRPELHAEHLDQRLGALAGVDARVRALLEGMLAHDPLQRPSSEGVAARCEELGDALGGPSLSSWCRSRTWTKTEGPRDGPLVGQELTEGAVELLEEADESAPVVLHRPLPTVDPGGLAQRDGTVWLADPAPSAPTAPADPAPSTTALAADPPQRGSRALVWVVGLGCAVVAVGAVGVFGLALAGAVATAVGLL